MSELFTDIPEWLRHRALSDAGDLPPLSFVGDELSIGRSAGWIEGYNQALRDALRWGFVNDAECDLQESECEVLDIDIGVYLGSEGRNPLRCRLGFHRYRIVRWAAPAYSIPEHNGIPSNPFELTMTGKRCTICGEKPRYER